MSCSLCKLEVLVPIDGKLDTCSLRCGHLYHDSCVKKLVLTGKRKCVSCSFRFEDKDVIQIKSSNEHFKQDLMKHRELTPKNEKEFLVQKKYSDKIDKLQNERFGQLEPGREGQYSTCFICESATHRSSHCSKKAVIRSTCTTLRNENMQEMQILAKGTVKPAGPIIDQIQVIMFQGREMTREEVYWTLSAWFFPSQRCSKCGLAFCTKVCKAKVGGFYDFRRKWEDLVLPQMDELNKFFQD